jgi:hypothetical protein
MTRHGDPHPRLSRLLQFAVGLAAGCCVVLLVLLVARAGVPVGTAGWAGVFLAAWAAFFALIRFKLTWAIAGLALGVAAGSLVFWQIGVLRT